MDTAAGGVCLDTRLPSGTLVCSTNNLFTAVAFSYFEALQRLGDTTKFAEEEARLRSFSNIFSAIGHAPDVYEDFSEETYDLLRQTSTASDDGAALLASFNDYGTSMSIITHLKVLTPRMRRLVKS